MKLSIQLVTWNSAKYLPALFASLEKNWVVHQRDIDRAKVTESDWILSILDNASTRDNTVQITEEKLKNFLFPWRFWQEERNTGFAGGHNRLFTICDAEYVLLVNHDMTFEPDCIPKLVAFLDTHLEAAGVAPRLMRTQTSDVRLQMSDVIDSLGLRVFRNRRVVDVGAGEIWHEPHPDPLLTGEGIVRVANPLLGEGKVDEANHLSKEHGNTRKVDSLLRGEGTMKEVFGLSGACALFRVSALKDVAFPDGTFLDESYWSYKEDVDLAFRLRSAGYRSFVLFDAVAYHERGAKSALGQDDRAAGKNKRDQASHVRYTSYRNHLMTLYKNEFWENFLLDFPWILWYEGKKFVWFLLFDRGVLRGLKEI